MSATQSKPVVLVVDDEADIRFTLRLFLEQAGYAVRDYSSATECLDGEVSTASCVISDIRMPEMNGLQLLEVITQRGLVLPAIFVTGHADVQLAVRAMKVGAIDFIEKPFDASTLLQSVQKALIVGQHVRSRVEEAKVSSVRMSLLTPREREVLDLFVDGQPHKIAARSLGISHRTVEIHRARIMAKTGAKNLSELVRITLASLPSAASHDARVRAAPGSPSPALSLI